MPTSDIFEFLIAERDKLNRAIEALQGPAARSGRAAKNAVASTLTVTPDGRRGMSAAARRALSRRMKAYWAKRRKEAAGKKA